MRDIQRLLGCLLFPERPVACTPYADLLSSTRWDDLAGDFAREACGALGQVGYEETVRYNESADMHASANVDGLVAEMCLQFG